MIATAATPGRPVIEVDMECFNSLISLLRHDQPQQELCTALAEAALKNRKCDQWITVMGAKPIEERFAGSSPRAAASCARARCIRNCSSCILRS